MQQYLKFNIIICVSLYISFDRYRVVDIIYQWSRCLLEHHLFIFVVIVVLIDTVYINLIKRGSIVVVVVFKFSNIIVNYVVVLDVSWLVSCIVVENRYVCT